MDPIERLESISAVALPDITPNGQEGAVSIENSSYVLEKEVMDEIPENAIVCYPAHIVEPSDVEEPIGDGAETAYEPGDLVIDDTNSINDDVKFLNQNRIIEIKPTETSPEDESAIQQVSFIESHEVIEHHEVGEEDLNGCERVIEISDGNEEVANDQMVVEEVPLYDESESLLENASIGTSMDVDMLTGKNENKTKEVIPDIDMKIDEAPGENDATKDVDVDRKPEGDDEMEGEKKTIDEADDDINNSETNQKDDECSALVYRTEPANLNFQNAILEDWDAEVCVNAAENEVVVHLKEEENTTTEAEEEESVAVVNELVEPASKSDESNAEEKVSTAKTHNGISPALPATPKPRLYLSTSNLSKKEVLDEILRRKPKSGNAILPTKDIILAMEIAKHSTQGSMVAMDTEKNSKQDENDILKILEAEQVGDWRGGISAATGKKGNDLDIKREVNKVIGLPKNTTKRYGRPSGEVSEKIKENKRKRLEDKARQRRLALEQLAKDFKERIPKRRPAKDIAAVDLKRVLASTPVLTGKRKRRPCYQPPADDEADESSVSTTHPIKTYTPRVKTSKPQVDIETELETIAIFTKHLNQPDEPEKVEATSNLQFEKTTAKHTAKKHKGDEIKRRRPGRELQQLLGDEGAVRMLYDAAKKSSPADSQRILKHTKKELEKKAKFVENAVLHLSGASEKALRGKRLTAQHEEKPTPVEPLFPPALPDIVSSTPIASVKKKKPKPAEASRILYRHSSSESFDGSEGLRRSISEISGLDITVERSFPASAARNDSSLPQRKSSRPRKVSSKFSEYVADSLFLKKLKKVEEPSPMVTDKDRSLSETFVSPKSSKPSNKRGESSEKLVSASSKNSEKATLVKSESRDILVSQKGALVEISLSSTNATFKNALTKEVINELESAVSCAAANPSCKAVLLTSTSNVFCQGVDLGVLSPEADVSALVIAIKSLATTLIFMEKPVIVGVQGVAVGMGVALLALCDVVVASEESSFYTPYGRLGQGPEAAASFTFPRIGKALVSELIYKGSVLSADDAFQLGLISQVVSSAKYESELAQVVDAIVSQNNLALQESKKLIFGVDQQNMVDALERECAALLKSWQTPDCLSAIAAYLNSGELLSN